MKVIGFSNVYYTLWDVEKEDVYITVNNEHRKSGTNIKYTYYQNLSKFLDKANEKFLTLTGENAPKPDETLNGKSNSFSLFEKSEIYNKGEFNFGKYAGQLIINCTDYKYLLWCLSSDSIYNEDKENAKTVLLSNGYVENLNKTGICTVDELNNQIEQNKKALYEKSLIRGFNFNDKEKIELDVTVHSISGFNSQYGYINVYQFLTSDLKIVKYSGNKYYSVEVGDNIKIKGTIKHNSFYSDMVGDNVKETKILRMKIINI